MLRGYIKLKGAFDAYPACSCCAKQARWRCKKDCLRFFWERRGRQITLLLFFDMRYTANVKLSTFYLLGILILWRLYHHRSLNCAKQLPNNAPVKSGWQPVFTASNNSMLRCTRSYSHSREGAHVGILPARTAAFCLRSRHHSINYLSCYL